MSNEDSRSVPDTRGRPRNEVMDKLVDKIESTYMKNKLPLEFRTADPKQDAKKLRLSTSFQQMQQELGIKFRVLAMPDRLTVCLGKR